ncbi:MAG: IPExxxVDY family protein [Polaribacter sp.]|jgi:hypothetical protein|nr:IPExxxVDY family protein [Polaribacter sp.]MDG1245383.1 IPExxxVDY family protein [Polaribacter sp.]MDG1321603.1 IPExxxVDY family protein [Polaribacter sp.]
MQVHALDLHDFYEEKYSLLGIHTTLEDYKLAYVLNHHLGVRFNKASFNLDFENEKSDASFSIYTYENSTHNSEWYLISNSEKKENKVQEEGLLLSTEIKNYLIPEKKKIDFFVKIVEDIPLKETQKLVNKIKSIDQIITAYTIDTNTLKSKDILIF